MADAVAPHPSLLDRLAASPRVLALLLLAPPLAWLLAVYLASLATLLVQSFFSIDDFSGLIVPVFTLATYAELLTPANLDILLRSVTMAIVVTLACAAIALPIAILAARYARGRAKTLFYLAVMVPLWSSYLVRVYAWKLILAKEGALTWALNALGLGPALDAYLSVPLLGGPSLSVSYTGTFLVFVYLWLPYMILPAQAALERVPASLLEASSDLGASPRQTLRTVILPLAMPGLAAGSIFTFSLTLGDYIAPTIVGPSSYFLGQVVYVQQGTAGNLPLAAAFSVVPIAVIALYLTIVRRLGAFDAL